MNIDPLRDELDEVSQALHIAGALPAKGGAPYALFGSAVMLLHGLRDEIADVDVFVAPVVYAALLRSGWEAQKPDPYDPSFLEREVNGYQVHAFYAWTDKDPEVNADQCRRTAELAHGWWCTPLDLIRLHKVMARKHGNSPRHRKHAADVIVIDRYQQTLTAADRAELELLRDVAGRLITFDGGAELMSWEAAHRRHRSEPYIGCPFCRDHFVLREEAQAA